jgi:DNA-directed RNA polymerase subunit RPC12/RpoP
MEWYKCPLCGEKLFWIHPDAVIKKAFIRCISCIKLIEVNVEPKNL